MKRKKILLSLLLICSLLMIDTRLVFAEDGLTWNLSTEPRNYSNSKSSGTICYMANTNTKVCKIFYDDDYEIIFSNEKDGIVIAWLVDEYGTAYFCKELDDSDANRNYQIYYYNRDVTKGLEPLIINNSKVYVDDLHFVRLDGIKIYFKNLICEDNSIIEEISSPSYEEVLESYEKNNNSQETTSPTNEPIIIPSESPSGENQNTSSPSVTSLPTNSPLNVNTATPKNSSSPNQKNTATPSATNSPSSGNSSSSDGTNKFVVKKVKNTTKLLQNGKIVERFVFNKKTGNVKFYGRKKVKKVKYVFFIKKSYNYGFITKKGKFYIIKRDSHKIKRYSGKWKKAVIKNNLGIKIKNSKKTKKIIGL